MLNVEDARRISCNALRDKIEGYISDAAAEGKGNVIIESTDLPNWLKAELATEGFVLIDHERRNLSPVVEVFWGAVKNDK